MQNLPIFIFKWVRRQLKTVFTPPCWVPTRPQWQGGRVGTHKPRGWLNEKMKKTFFTKKLIFWKNEFFFKTVSFFIFFVSQAQFYGYPRNPLAIVVMWVPIMGVYNQFLVSPDPFKISTFSQKCISPPKKWFFWMFSATWTPNEVKFGVKIDFWETGRVILILGTFDHFWPSYGKKLNLKMVKFACFYF